MAGQQRMSGPVEDPTLAIAVIGVGFRGPGDAINVEAFYKLLAEARQAWSPIPKQKWNAEAHYHPDGMRNGSTNVKGGHFFKQDLSLFDAPFFNMTPAEAACLDPQQRLLLETCYEAIENSGTSLASAMGSNTSTFVGTFGADYTDTLLRDPEVMPVYQTTNSGHSRAIISNRLAYFFDFKGTSVTVDTACSASMTAFHLACQSLRTGDSRQAIVGGSSVILSSDLFISMSAMRFLSPDGRSYSFDERANGYARGEGVGCIMLKPLSAALADGDTIRAVVRHTGSNQDGRTPGISFPSRDAQMALAKRVYEQSGLDPLHTTYVEAHGTGTQAGDPIEASAISEAIACKRPSDTPLVIGSVKSNVGHMEGASGIAGLVKSILMLENGMILPNHDFRVANERIPLEDWRLDIAKEYTPWLSKDNIPRRLSINSFGYGGTNAHAILEEADGYLRTHNLHGRQRKTFSLIETPAVADFSNVEASLKPRLFVLSAADPVAGKSFALVLARYLRARLHIASDRFLDDMAYTLNTRRSRLAYIAPVAARSAQELIEALESDILEFTKTGKAELLAFVFTGQGAQWAGMGKELMDAFPVYRETVQRCSTQLQALGAEWDLVSELHKESKVSQINSSMLSQPLCTVIQLGLVDLLASWGILPASVTGHSSGEIAAAYAARVLTLEDAVTAAYYRGVVCQKMATRDHSTGAMIAVGLSTTDALPLIDSLSEGRAAIACINSPSSITVSGDSSAIEELEGILKGRQVFARKLAVPVAYHSHHMQLVGQDYADSISGLRTSPNTVDYFSSVTGLKASHAELGSDYWVANLLGQVKFAEALRVLCNETAHRTKRRRKGGQAIALNTIVEIGPHAALAGPIRQILKVDQKIDKANIAYLSAMVRGQDAVSTTMALGSKLLRAGYHVDLNALNRPTKIHELAVLTDLPSYQWNHAKSYWAEGRLSKAFRNRAHARNDLLGVEDRNFNPYEQRWRNILRISEVPWLKDHKIQSNVVFPAAGYIAIAIEASLQKTKSRGVKVSGYSLREIVIGQALVIPEDTGEVEINISLKPYSASAQVSSDQWDEFFVYSVSMDGLWTEHSRGLVSVQHKKAALNDFNDVTGVNGIHGVNDINGINSNKVNGINGVNGVNSVNGVAPKNDMQAKRTKSLADPFVDIAVEEFYKTLTELGLQYGPIFANVTSLKSGQGVAVGQVKIADTAAVMPTNYQSPLVLHPSTLDAMFHPLFAAAAGSGDLKDPMVPIFIEEVFVSSDIERNLGEQINVSCSTVQTDHRHCKASLTATSTSGGHTNDPVLKISGLACVALARDISSNEDKKVQKQAFQMKWNADVEFLRAQELQSATDALVPLTRYIGLIAHKIPNAKILCQNFAEHVPQVIRVLKTLGGSDADNALAKVFFTGRSESFDLAEIFAPWSSMIEYKKVDIEGDMPTEGLEASSFDVILDLDFPTPVKTSHQSRKAFMALIKPLGFYITSCHPQNLPEADVSVIDLGAFTVVRRKKEIAPPTHRILVIGDGVASQDLKERVLFELRDRHPSVITSPSLDNDPSGKVCIIISDWLNQALKDLDSATWESLKRVCLQSSGIIWVTQGAASGKPLSNMVTGLLRTVRSENGQVPVVTLDLDAVNVLSSSQAASKIIEIYDDTFRRKIDSADRIESEFQERSGQILIPRLVEDVETNTALHTITTDARPTKMSFKQAERPLRIDIGTPGLLDSLYFVDDEDMTGSLPDDCIEVEVKASGLNFRDVMMALGQIAIDALGGEVSGIVKAIGKSVTSYRVGDRVAGCHLGSFRNLVRPKALLMTAIPDEMSFETASALPVIYCTAYHSLFNVGRLQEGETVLIHAASGGVGQAAIELCRLIGAEVLVTVGSLEKKNFLIQDYGLKPENIFYSRDGSFAESIKTATKGKGVDVILNSLAGEALRLTWTCIAPYGRFIELGKRDFFINSRLDMAKFAKNVSFSAVDLVSLVRDKPKLMSDVWRRVMDLLRIGSVRPPTPITTYPMSDIHKALSLMQSGKHTGKLVVVPSATDIVMAIPRKDDQNILDPGSSYVLVGGLGGIGRAIAIWMFEHGARNLVFINRSGLKKQEAKDTIALLQNRGANAVVLSCDVSDASKLTEHVNSVQEIRPIKGVVQGAMVLKDMMLDKMTVDDWNTSVKPKVQGTINLHECLPKELDFFIMLSSVSGVIGNASQGNYAAANTFMDAFAEYRRSLGLRGTSLDLGVILGVGHVAEDVELAKAMERQGFYGTTEKDLMALIQIAILGRNSSSQVVTGLGTYKPATAIGSVSNSPLFSAYRNSFLSSASPGSGDSDTVRAALTSCSSLDEAARIVLAAIIEKTAALCMVPQEDIKSSKPLSEYGLDSLVAVEMRNWIFKQLDCTIPILELLANTSITNIARRVAEKSRLVEAAK